MRTPAVSLVLSLVLVACGGKVVVDPVENPAPTCEDVCNKSIAACGGTATDCASSCAQSEKIFAALCSDAWDAFLVCVNDNPAAQCQSSNGCNAELTDLTTCVAMACASNPTACIQ
jgi:hypothetical protein